MRSRIKSDTNLYRVSPYGWPMFALAMAIFTLALIVGYALVVGNRKVANRNLIRFYARSSLLANETFPTI